MTSLIFAQTLLIGLLMAPAAKTQAAGYNPADGRTPAVSLAYRLARTGHLKNQYTLTLVRPETEPAQIRILARDGQEVSRTSLKEATAFCRLDMHELDPGQYTVQIRSGRQLREEKVTVQ